MPKKYVFTILMMLILVTAANMFISFAEITDPADWAKGDAGFGDIKDTMEEGGRSILSLVETFGKITGLVILLIYGVKWFMSRNDSSARKELKDHAVGYVVGAIIFFGAIPLYNLIFNFAKSFK